MCGEDFSDMASALRAPFKGTSVGTGTQSGADAGGADSSDAVSYSRLVCRELDRGGDRRGGPYREKRVLSVL